MMVNLETFTVRGNPPPQPAQGLFVALVGHLARDPTKDTPATPADRLVRAYRRHGTRLSATLLGQYAAVLVDPLERRLLLVQDSLGIHPLFYTLERGRLVVSANLETLVAFLRPISLNETYFAEYLVNGFPPHQPTPYSCIERLAFGTTLLIEPARRIALQPWSPPMQQEQTRPEDAALRLRTLLDDAVSSTLPAEGRILCELSGGLDSTSVLATAYRQRPDVQALTISSGRGMSGDDESFAGDAVNALGVQWHRIDGDLYPHCSSLPTHFSGEPGNEMKIALQTAYRDVLAREGIDVVLTGSAGDVVFGYGSLRPIHLADALFRGHLLTGIKAARKWSHHAGGQRPWTHYFLHFGVLPAWRHLRRQSLIIHDGDRPPRWLAPDFARRHGFDGSASLQSAPRVSLPGSQYLWEGIYELAGHASPSFRLHLDADTRHPLFYRPLVEFMLGLDPNLRHGPEGDRVLQRKALVDRLPEAIRTRQTKGSDQQLSEKAQMYNDRWYRALTEDSHLVARGWVNPQRWRAQVERARFGVYNGIASYNAAVMIEWWLRTIECHPPEPSPQLYEPRVPAVQHPAHIRRPALVLSA